jgi:hypothetical protein
MVASGQHIRAQVKQVFGNLRGQTEAARSVFAIDNHEVDSMGLAHVPNVLTHNPAPRTAKHIANKQNIQQQLQGSTLTMARKLMF